MANIANIAQTSPQYVLDKNAIKAEIVNQAAIAARTNTNVAKKPLGPGIHYDGTQRLNHMLYENMMLGSNLSASPHVPQP